MAEIETREKRILHACELRAANGDGVATLTGYAAVYESKDNDPGLPWDEYFARGAFGESISRGDDVRALVEHSGGLNTIGRRSAGTLELADDQRGVKVTISPPDTQVGRDVTELVRRGDLGEMSVGFRVITDEWSMVEGVETRRILKADLFDVSIVSFAAYPDTTIGLRSRQEWQKRLEADKIDPETLAQRAERARMRQYRRELLAGDN